MRNIETHMIWAGHESTQKLYKYLYSWLSAEQCVLVLMPVPTKLYSTSDTESGLLISLSVKLVRGTVW